MGTQPTKLKICLCEKFGLFNNCNVDNNCYLYNLLLCNYQDPKLLKGSILKSTTIYLPLNKKKYLRITTKGLPTIDDTI
jgi:hypothetical protein